MTDDDRQKICVSVQNGLNKAETEAVIGHRMDDDELTTFNRAKGVAKLRKNKEKRDSQQNKESGKTYGITGGMHQVLPALYKRISKEEFIQCIEQNCGITTAICNQLDCTFSQYWHAVKKWGLEEFVAESRKSLVSIAEKVMSDLLNSEDERIRFQSANYILKTQGATQGWSEPKNITQIDATNGTVSIKQIFGIEDEQ